MEIEISELNKYFDEIFLINLDSRKDRYQECLNEFSKHNITAKRISAVDGKKSFKPGMNLNPGNLGLVETNIKIFEYALENNLNHILILEDDVLFIDDINKLFKEKIKSLPDDWDLIYLGGSHMFNKGKFKSISKDVDQPIDATNYKNLNHELCSTTWTQTTHAVGINKKNIKRYLEIMKKSNRPIDMIYCDLQQAGDKTFTFLPSVALQRASFSDIENQHVDYNTNKRWNF